ncbi:hypothetical protein [Fulvivirga ligni]|uniref:hypothetical protein n=1 Tax=Fulvivirga ligni TaxID=2904246 RepID=UPI001F1D8FA1|nr:hypothetical protein [Fulvivirga ligni]UII21521.1 hypothetical protein LVD16_27210 [Fulvivirga ligni]
MNDFDQWQNLWQQQKSESVDADDLIRSLKKIEKTRKVQRVLIPTLFAFSLISMITHLTLTAFNIALISAMGIGMLLLVLPLFKGKIATSNYQLLESNELFLDQTISGLKQRAKIPKRIMIFNIILFIVFNMAFFYFANDFKEYSHAMLWRIGAHLLTLVIFVEIYVVFRKASKNYVKNIAPLIVKLQDLRSEKGL